LRRSIPRAGVGVRGDVRSSHARAVLLGERVVHHAKTIAGIGVDIEQLRAIVGNRGQTFGIERKAQWCGRGFWRNSRRANPRERRQRQAGDRRGHHSTLFQLLEQNPRKLIVQTIHTKPSVLNDGRFMQYIRDVRQATLGGFGDKAGYRTESRASFI
jgi:hypothetical protein